MGKRSVYLFYSYAHEDEALRDELVKHLKIMERRGVIRSWHDRKIMPGADWDHEINQHLNNADLILLLISSDFINSDYIWGNELKTAMERHKKHEANVVPIMLRSVFLDDAPFASLQGLPKDFKPVTSWDNRDEAWTDVAKGIRNVVKEIIERLPEEDEEELPSAPSRSRSVRGGVLPPRSRSVSRGGTRSHGPGSMESFSHTRGAEDEWHIESDSFETPATEADEGDDILQEIIDSFTDGIDDAAKQRKIASIDMGAVKKAALSLIDNPEQKRVLWVDNNPDSIAREKAALAKLQIEVVNAQTTEQALETLAKDDEGIDLILSDWNRPEQLDGAPSAGIKLLRALKQDAHADIPVVFYHGAFDPGERTSRSALAIMEGAAAEAVRPDDLIVLINKLLG